MTPPSDVSIWNIYSTNVRKLIFAKEILLKLKHKTPHIKSGRLKQQTLIKGQIIQTEIEQRKNGTNRFKLK